MAVYSVDTEFIINEITPRLKDLCERCTVKAREAPWNSEKDSGQTRYKLVVMTDIVHENWAQMVYLINKSISFLTSASGTVDENDSIMKVDPATGAIYEPIPAWYYDNINIWDENGHLREPYSRDQFAQYYHYNEEDGIWHLECVGYVWARFEEITGYTPGFGSIECAANLIKKGYWQNDPNFTMNYDPNSVNCPAIVVTDTKTNGTGHVVIVEHIKNGQVWYSEANHFGQSDGTMTCVSIEEFMASLPEGSGFIQLKQ